MLEKLGMSLAVAAIGIVVVFAILLLLVVIIELISKLINTTQKASKGNGENAEVEVIDDTIATETQQNNGAIIAAITAAIYAVLSSENGNEVVPEFQIRKIRQIKR
ncbi:MAG: OadG family transporter subunit [Clostridia bacterium]